MQDEPISFRLGLRGQLIVDIICWHGNNVSQVYDGVRRRALPVLFGALEAGTDDDRMKGALWTINSTFFGKYAISGW